MKLLPDAIPGLSISGYGPGWIDISGERIQHSIVISSFGWRVDWNCARFEDLGAPHFDLLLPAQAELVVFGSGAQLRFPQPQWLQSLYAQRVGVETMDTPAACRTFNFLAGEGRRVVAALLM